MHHCGVWSSWRQAWAGSWGPSSRLSYFWPNQASPCTSAARQPGLITRALEQRPRGIWGEREPLCIPTNQTGRYCPHPRARSRRLNSRFLKSARARSVSEQCARAFLRTLYLLNITRSNGTSVRENTGGRIRGVSSPPHGPLQNQRMNRSVDAREYGASPCRIQQLKRNVEQPPTPHASDGSDRTNLSLKLFKCLDAAR